MAWLGHALDRVVVGAASTRDESVLTALDALAEAEGRWWDALIDAATEASKQDALADAVRLKANAKANTEKPQDDAEAWAWFEGELVNADKRQAEADAGSVKTKQEAVDKAYGARLKSEAQHAATLDKVEAGAWSAYVAAVGAADVTDDIANSTRRYPTGHAPVVK